MTRGPWVMSKTSKAVWTRHDLARHELRLAFHQPHVFKRFTGPRAWAKLQKTSWICTTSAEDQDAFAYRQSNEGCGSPERRPTCRRNCERVHSQEETRPHLCLSPGRIHQARHDVGGLVQASSRVPKGGRLGHGRKCKWPERRCGCAVVGQRRRVEGTWAWNRWHESSPLPWWGFRLASWALGQWRRPTARLPRRALGWDDLDVIELNEAFAAQSLACIRSWGLEDDDARINPNGGAIALGSPLGMTGARILLAAARQLKRTGGKYGLVTLCIGVGQGYAVVIRNSSAS